MRRGFLWLTYLRSFIGDYPFIYIYMLQVPGTQVPTGTPGTWVRGYLGTWVRGGSEQMVGFFEIGLDLVGTAISDWIKRGCNMRT